MAIVSRPNVYVDGTTAEAAEVNADFDALYTLVNGDLDDDNIAAGAGIAASKIDPIPPSRVLDHADDDAEYMDSTDPGTTAVISRPTNLEEELERIRYRFFSNAKLSGVFYMDAAGVAQAVGWIEPAVLTEHQILPNNGFEVKTSATATDAPDEWTLYGTPTDCSIVTTAATEFGGHKRSLRITGDAAEGVQFTAQGLKKSTKYIVGMAYVRVAGTVAMSTTGGLGSGAYQNLNLTVASGTTATYLQGIVSTDSSATDVVVRFHGGASSTEFRIYQVWMYEVADRSTLDIPRVTSQTATYSTADDTVTNTGAGAWSNRSALSLSQYVPAHGYRLRYEVTLCFKSTTSGGGTEKTEYAFRIQRNIDSGGATTVEGPYAWRTTYVSNNEFGGGTVTLNYVLDNPTPGSTYAMTTDVYTEGSGDGAGTIIFNPTVATGLATQSRARLLLERI